MNQVTKSKIIKACHKSIWSKDYIPSEYKSNECDLIQDIAKNIPPKQLKIKKNVTHTSSLNELPKIRKPTPGIYYFIYRMDSEIIYSY